MFSEPFEITTIQELDLNSGVTKPELSQLAILPCHERLPHDSHLDVEVYVGQVEIRCHCLGHAATVVAFENERPRFIFPGDTLLVEHACVLELDRMRKLGWLASTVRMESGLIR